MKMMALLILTFTSAVSFADGNSVNNGGGVICIQQVCKTLIEAGLRLTPELDGIWIPESAHYDAVRSTLYTNVKIFRIKQDEINFSVFGRGDHFRKVDVIDPVKLEAIRKQYIEVATQAGFPLDPATFEIVAFSSDNTVKPALTYLLPKFFELSLAQQASMLLHEGLYRGRPSTDLKYVLQFESSIAEVSRLSPLDCNPDLNDRPPYYGQGRPACVNQQILSYRLGYLTKSELLSGILSLVLNSKSFGESQFGEFEFSTKKAVLKLDPKKVLNYASVEPRLPYMLSKLKVVDFVRIRSESDSYYASPNVDWLGKDPTMIIEKYGEKHFETFRMVDNENLQILLPN